MGYVLSLEGKTAIVTGGAGGLGLVITEALARAGARVMVASRRLEACQAVAKALSSYDISACSVDVTDRNSIEQLAESTLKRYGAIDILVNNAGISPFAAPLTSTRAAGLKKILDVNLTAALECTQVCVPAMMTRTGAVVLNVASSAAAVGVAGIGAYAVSKAALVKLTEQLAGELGPSGIRVNAIAPGFMGVGVAKWVEGQDDWLAPLIQRTPLRRTGRPHEISAAVVFLASEEASYITGQTLFVDGGASTW
ncbi:MAG: glucose 1-dehydrogenase [Thermaerobacter sp.]|nr:glucose 1-dehydrogenase [Thermaerobacter sp.]